MYPSYSYYEEFRRIASALERIAKALESQSKPEENDTFTEGWR